MLLDIHPDNEVLVAAFLALQTQWRVVLGFKRVIYQGIDYGAIPPVLALLGIPHRERNEAFAAIRVMESTALEILNEPPENGDG